MEPIEINAGAWYLRALRSDERIDDRPALRASEDPEFLERAAQGWRDDTLLSWAVCAATSTELIALVQLRPAASELTGWAHAGHADALAAGLAAVQRFAAAALGVAAQVR